MSVCRSKNVLFVSLLLCVLSSIATVFSGIVTSPLRASAEDTFGYDLPDGYDVRIVYEYDIRYASGVYIGYEAVFDKDFFQGIEDKSAFLEGVKDTFVKNGYLTETDTKNGSMKAYMEFSSTTDYYVATGQDGYEVGEKREPSKKSLFYNEYVTSFQSVFASVKTEGRFVNRIYNACLSAGIPEERMTFRYVYGTPYNQKTIRSDADSVPYSSSTKLYYHTFDFTTDTVDRYLTITQRTPNSSGWYLVAVLAAALVLSVPLTVAVVKRKEKKNAAKNNG